MNQNALAQTMPFRVPVDCRGAVRRSGAREGLMAGRSSRMDHAATSFQAMTAKVKYLTHRCPG